MRFGSVRRLSFAGNLRISGRLWHLRDFVAENAPVLPNFCWFRWHKLPQKPQPPADLVCCQPSARKKVSVAVRCGFPCCHSPRFPCATRLPPRSGQIPTKLRCFLSTLRRSADDVPYTRAGFRDLGLEGGLSRSKARDLGFRGRGLEVAVSRTRSTKPGSRPAS